MTWAHRLPILIDAFPNLQKVTLLGSDVLLPERQDESDLLATNHNEEDLCNMWDDSRDEFGPNDMDEWNDFLQNREKTFALEALVDFAGEFETEMVRTSYFEEHSLTLTSSRWYASILRQAKPFPRRLKNELGGMHGH